MKKFFKDVAKKYRSFAIILWLLDSIFLFFVKAKPQKNLDNVLVIYPEGIGDFILWLDSAKELCQLLQKRKYKIVLIGNKVWCAFSKELDLFDEIFPIDRDKFIFNIFYRYKVMLKIYCRSFSKVIYPRFSREFYLGDAMVRVSGAKERIGLDGDLSNIEEWQKKVSDRWYTKLVRIPIGVFHEQDINAKFIKELGGTDYEPSRIEISSFTANEKLSIHEEEYYILIPGAGMVKKRWPITAFIELAQRIYEKNKCKGIICGGKQEKQMGDFIVKHSKAPLQNLAGRTSIKELMGVIAKSRFLVSNDSGAVHIAAALGKLTVCVLGGGHFGRFLPYRNFTKEHTPIIVNFPMDCYGCNWKCKYKIRDNIFPCIKNVTVDMVWEKIKKHSIIKN